MSTRAAIEELLHAGYGNKAIARQVHVRHQRVAEVRAELGLPNIVRPARATYSEDAFWRRTQPVPGGHLNWTGHYNSTGVPCLRTTHGMHTAYRIAFRIRWQRDPDGPVKPGCDMDRCVHPDHVEDRPMRQQYTAIFGEVAA
ncbi:hypothetical protein [Streptomyces sp. NPDC055642]